MSVLVLYRNHKSARITYPVCLTCLLMAGDCGLNASELCRQENFEAFLIRSHCVPCGGGSFLGIPHALLCACRSCIECYPKAKSELLSELLVAEFSDTSFHHLLFHLLSPDHPHLTHFFRQSHNGSETK